MLGLPEILPLSRLPSAIASARRVLLTTPTWPASPALHWTPPPACPQALLAQSIHDGTHTFLSTLAPSLLWVSPRGTHSRVHLGSRSFPFHIPTFIRSCLCSLSGLLQNVLPPSLAPLLPCGCRQVASSRTHPDWVSLCSQACSPEDRWGRNL